MNIKGFKDIQKDDKKKKDDKKVVDSFVGGQSSGLNVENPDDVEGFNKQDNKIKLTVWQNGFQIDDGEFRGIEDTKNKEFMEEVEKGFIPQELVKKGYKNLGIMLEDKKKQMYEPPKVNKKFQAFEGNGQSISNQTSTGLEINRNIEFKVDNNSPTTKINLRLHNGQNVVQVFNLTHTVHDIRVYVNQIAPVNGTFDLIEGFPPKPLSEEKKSIKELKLEGTTISQRLN